MTKTGNLNFEYIHSGLQTEGYFYDNYFDDGAIMRDQERVKNMLKQETIVQLFLVPSDVMNLHSFLIMAF